jgi:transcriptional regulator with XRE-family HTH domain
VQEKNGVKMLIVMGKTKLELPPLDVGAKNIGKHIAVIRKAKGFTQLQLAEKIGIIQVLVSDYENNKLRLNAEMILRFAKALNVTADQLLGLDSQNIEPPIQSKHLWKKLRKAEELPNADRKALLKILDGLLAKNGIPA